MDFRPLESCQSYISVSLPAHQHPLMPSPIAVANVIIVVARFFVIYIARIIEAIDQKPAEANKQEINSFSGTIEDTRVKE